MRTKFKISIVGLALAGIFIALCIEGDALRASQKNQEPEAVGKWKIVAADIDGVEWDADALVGKVIEFKADGSFTTNSALLKAGKGTYKVDQDKKPKTIDLVATEGPFKGKPYPGIYEIVDGNLRLYCANPLAANPPVRPKKPVAKPEFGVLRMTLGQ